MVDKIPEHYFKQYYELLEEVNGLQEIEVVIKNTDDKERITLMGVVDLLNTYEDQLAEMGGTIDGLEVEVKRLNDKYTVDHCDCENLRLEVQRLENENERLKEELRLALN